MNTTRILLAASVAAGLAAFSGTASAQQAQANPVAPATPGQVWRDGSGNCVRTGYWTPSMASPECDPTPKPVARPAPKPKPAPKLATMKSVELFAFNSSVLSPQAKAQLDRDVMQGIRQFATVQFINVNGHTDRIGSATYNQKLSEKRAEAVKAYLISKGVDGSKIETYGYGKTQPVKSCPDTKDQKALRDCLQPNRRVEVEVKGMPR